MWKTVVRVHTLNIIHTAKLIHTHTCTMNLTIVFCLLSQAILAKAFNFYQDSFSYPTFDVEIHDKNAIDPSDALKLVDDNRDRYIMVKMGHSSYICDLGTDNSTITEEKRLKEWEEWPPAGVNTSEYIPAALEALGSLSLVRYTYGTPLTFWAYTLEYGDKISQLFADKDTWNPREGTQWYTIGDFSKTDLKKKTTIEYNGETHYVKQRIEEGTPCDINGKPRSADVHFICDPEREEGILEMGEVRTCFYKVILNTHVLCDISIFKPPEQPAPEIVACQLIVDKD